MYTYVIGAAAAALIEQHALSHGIQLADALIAATAIESGHPLCTADTKHFRPVPDPFTDRFPSAGVM